MTTGLSYNGSVTGTNSYVAQIATMAVVEPADTNFLTILPQAITYAENRMYRDLDFLHTSVSLTFPLVAGSRNLSIGGIGGSDYPFVVSEQINIVTPSSVTDPNDPLATRNPCLSVTKEFIDQVYGSSAPANRGGCQAKTLTAHGSLAHSISAGCGGTSSGGRVMTGTSIPCLPLASC